MIAINAIIDTLSTKEKQQFTSYLKDKNKRSDTKNIELFKLMTDGITNSKEICQILYKCDNRNAYHALRKRLIDALIDFTANKNLEDENSVDMQIIKYILASRTFLLQKNYSIAFKLLHRAEQLADEHSLFPILNEIYHTQIQYAPNYPEIDLNTLIKKQKANQQKHHLEDQLNIVYSKLKTALNKSNYEGEQLDFESILKDSLKDLDINLNESLSFKSLYQILAIANISAFVTTNYYKIEDFVLNSYEVLKAKKETNKQLFYQIHIVYIIANTLFRIKKFETSLRYIDEMEQLINSKRGVYKKEFILKLTLIKALNLNYKGYPKDAISTVEPLISKKHNDIEGLLDLHLTLLMFYFQQEDFKNAKSILSKFYHTDQWYIEKAGVDWVIKKNIAEILLYIELDEYDLFYSRLKSFKRNYTPLLKDKSQIGILDFLKVSEQLYLNSNRLDEPSFKQQIESTLINEDIVQEDVFIISIYAWLKSKLNNTSLYHTTLELMR